MAARAARACVSPGCPAIVRGASRCPQHQRQQTRQRGTSAQRGYGYRWQQLRARFLKVHPFCWCGETATDVDHIVPKRNGGPDDWANLQSLCHPHHSQKTARQSRP